MILQVGKSYPFIRVAFEKKPVNLKRDFYPTDQHLFDPEKDRLLKIEGFNLVVGGLNYDNSKTSPDGFKRSYHLRDDDGGYWVIYYPEEEPIRIWRPFELMAYRQDVCHGICAVHAEELMTAYCRKMHQRQGMLQSDLTYLWAEFYSKLQRFVQDSMQLNPEVYPYEDPITKVTMAHIPTVKLKPY